jgi:hypothetical protein
MTAPIRRMCRKHAAQIEIWSEVTCEVCRAEHDERNRLQALELERETIGDFLRTVEDAAFTAAKRAVESQQKSVARETKVPQCDGAAEMLAAGGNRFGVGRAGGLVVLPDIGPYWMTKEEAFNLAAWIVLMAGLEETDRVGGDRVPAAFLEVYAKAWAS